ncbi:MAG: hypothetical protein LBD14_03340 [Puniceicoccales bacterium]|jgi:hypothetical protein|nr:hypothetical protein [Puniceicoccales bacterium]
MPASNVICRDLILIIYIKNEIENKDDNFFLCFPVLVACQREILAPVTQNLLTAKEHEPVFCVIDIPTGLPIIDNSVGKRELVSRKWLYENCNTSQKIENLKKRLSKNDRNAAVQLLAAAWFVLPPENAAEVVQFVHHGIKSNDSLVNYYLGLFHWAGYGIDFNYAAGLQFFENSYKSGCHAAGLLYFDLLESLGKTERTSQRWHDWLAFAKSVDNPEYSARIGWAEHNGFGMEKNEHRGRVKILNAAINGSKFANLRLALWALDARDFSGMLNKSRMSLSDVLINSFLLHGDALRFSGNEGGVLMIYREARRLNRDALFRLADYFYEKKNYDEYAKVVLFVYLDLKLLQRDHGVNTGELKRLIGEWQQKLNEADFLPTKMSRRAIGNEVKKMMTERYYFNSELEEKFRQEFLNENKN